MVSNEEILEMMKDPDKVTDEQIFALMNRLQEGEKKDDKPADTPQTQQLSVQMADGTVLKANSAEELAQMAAAHRPAAPEAPKPAADDPFDAKKWAEIIQRDPIAAQDYLDKARYGFSVKDVVPLMGQMLAGLTQKVQEYEQERVANVIPDPAQRAIVDGIVKELGMPDNLKSRQAAFELAKSRNLIQAQQGQPGQPTQQSGPFIPPRVSSAPVEVPLDNQFAMRADRLSDEQLENILFQAEYLKGQRRFS